MKKQVVAIAGVCAVGAASTAVVWHQWKLQRERREFAERYAKQLKAAREAQIQTVSSSRAASQQCLADAAEMETEEDAGAVRVIYGSESGNAEALAKGFVMSLRDRGVPAVLIDPNQWLYLDSYLYQNKANVPLFHPIKAACEPCGAATAGDGAQSGAAAESGGAANNGGSTSSKHRPPVYIFIVATAGEGEPPSNFMSLFQEMQMTVRRATTVRATNAAALKASDAPAAGAPPALPFKDLFYAVFALGDSSYKYFCRCGTDTNTLMKKGGGTNLYKVGFGDARDETEEDAFDAWKEKVISALHVKCGVALTSGTRVPPKPELQFRYVSDVSTTHAASAATAATALSPDGETEKSAVAAPPASTGTATKSPDMNVSMNTKNVSVIGKSQTSSNRAATLGSNARVANPSAPELKSVLPFPPPPLLLEPSLTNPARVRLVAKTLLAPQRSCDGSCVCRFCFETDGTGINYQAGDHLGIFPTNPPDMVARYAKALSLSPTELDTRVELCELLPSRGILRNVLPACVPLQVVLERYVDLCGIPKKSTLRVLAKYCTDHAQQDEFFGLLRAPTDMNSSINDENSACCTVNARNYGNTANLQSKKLRTVVDYLEHFPSCCCISIGHFLEIMPRIQPRYYSIASDRLSHGTQIEILVRVLTDGLNTTYLAERVNEGDEVFAYVRISTFHLPQRIGENRPILMIGPGTGAAAMVGLCYKKEALMRKNPTQQYGTTMFFFGAQFRKTEYFIEEEVERWALPPERMVEWDAAHPDAHAGMAARRVKMAHPQPLPNAVVTHRDCAFSRDQPQKVYVMSLIDDSKDTIYEMLTSTDGGGCLVYLSGDASFMAKDVDRALSLLLQEKGGMTRVASLEFLRRMELDHRYLKDVY